MERNYAMPANLVQREKILTRPSFRIPPQRAERREDFTLPALFTDGCVLQAELAVRLWGRCAFDGGIAVRLRSDAGGEAKTFYGKTENHAFELFIEGQPCGGPYTLELISENGSCFCLKNVLFGEVFVLAGQSNMGWAFGQCYDGTSDRLLYRDLIASCENPDIREMMVLPVPSEVPVEELETCRPWRKITPETIREVSAVGYFFARRFYALRKAPVGLVSACMGGIPIAEWDVGGAWYNGQIHPIRRLTVRGVLWYQGEGDPVNYGARLAGLIGRWRAAFENPGLLWAAVQLPRYTDEKSYYESREEIKKAGTLTERFTYCVTLDTGLYPELAARGDMLNADGIHPYEKEPVGTRLADAVIGAFCDPNGLWTSSYAMKAVLEEDGRAAVTFANTGGGLILEGRAGFELAGPEGEFYDAIPELAAPDQIYLTCDRVADPVTVRYGYKNYSALADEPIVCCAQSVCVYNTRPDGAGEKAYPAEQFTMQIKRNT
ncbi:MAG TPA: hypothetical protein IAD50_03370 [Candidatus Egerieisoma faecipullorum]|uniref:Sialate O-acetylesterase domain-containing protein n=1 Tax=Candidatus Egerieisoma faecipullorum TaxID=2840963 RepID=A0A9D1I711_9CLOT|nr:hypothetical protein [Candidatus Egerieisoma faecipullorum]